jgi:TrkA domain protein
VRNDETLPAPGPDHVLESGDVLVAVGTPDGLRQLRDLLEA